MSAAKISKQNVRSTHSNASTKVGRPCTFEGQFRRSLPDPARGAFDVLVTAGCVARKIAGYLSSLSFSFSHHSCLQGHSGRMDWDALRSLVERTSRVAKDWETVLHSSFGHEVLQLARRCEVGAMKGDFLNVPQRLNALARCAKDIHKGTRHRSRPLYDDTLAELLVYVEERTVKPHLSEVSLLVGDVTKRPDYSFNDLGVWKHDHREAIERARLRLKQS